jgi:predicted ATP-dependent endonuclease of OLD family
MLKSLKIENFRCFQDFELQQLGRINLLVGTNNSGKTSILEAVQLLYARGDFDPIASMMERRGEYVLEDGKKQFEIAHLIHGHELKNENQFSIMGVDDNEVINKCLLSQADFATITISEGNKSICDFISENTTIDMPQVISTCFSANADINSQALLEIFSTAKNNLSNKKEKNDRDRKIQQLFIVMIANGNKSIIIDATNSELNFKWRSNNIDNSSANVILKKNRVINSESFPSHDNSIKHRLLTSSSLTPEETIELFDRTVLTPEEDLVYQALQTIEPKIKRIASVGSTHDRNANRGGFFVQFSDSKQRVPIGSMGDGMWRVLGIALALVDVKGGVLLIDEIDTGLHYSVMSDLWKLIWKTAKELDIQVFATTHNSDCWQSLAEVIESESIEDDLITIHRIEKGKNQSVMFNQRQIAIAAERGIEVR